MEEYRPVAADGAAPDGQTRLPWGDEAPVVAVEVHPPLAVEAQPPEPITHFATPEATFFTAEPPPAAIPDAEGLNGDGDGDGDVPDADDEAADEPPVEQSAVDEPEIDEPEIDEPPVEESLLEEPPDDVWADDAVDDEWADDEVWSPTAPVDDGPVAPQEEEPVAQAPPPDAPDEFEAMLDQLLPSADEVAPSEEMAPVLEAASIDDVEPPVADEPTAVADEPVVEEQPLVEEEPPPVVAEEESPPVVADAARMVSPSHPEWIEQERIVIDDAAPELEWADPEATDFGPPVDEPTAVDESAPSATQAQREPDRVIQVPQEEATAAETADWFNPPDPVQEQVVDAPAAEWLTLPELDEQLAAVSESPPPADELPPMVPADGAAPAPLPPVVGAPPPIEPAAFAPSTIEEAPPLTPADEPTLLEPLEALAPAVAVPQLEPAGGVEPVTAPTAVSEGGRGIRRILVVAAALVMGTLVVRQLNPGAIGNTGPTFVGVTGGEGSRSKHVPLDQPATAGSTGSEQAAAGATTNTTVAGNATTGSTTATTAAAGTATTAVGGKTTATTTAGPATTAPLRAPPPAPSSTPGYGAAHSACQKFNNAYAARDNGGMTDDQADDVFVNTASQVYGANQVNPQRWGTLYNHALTLQKQLEGTVDSTDDQIEAQIALVYNDCKAAA